MRSKYFIAETPKSYGVEFREIYRLVETARDGLPVLDGHADFYVNAIDDYQHTDDWNSELDDGRPVSRELVREASLKTAELMPEYQEIVQSLETALQEVDEYTSFRFIDGSRVKVDELEEQIDSLVTQYRHVFERIWSAGYRVKEHPDFDVNPIDMRMKKWRRDFEDRNPVDGTGLYSSNQESPEVLGELFT